MSFFEFTIASGNEALYRKMISVTPEKALPQSLHARLLNRILLSVAEQIGIKFVYSMVDPGVQAPVVKKALMLLSQAKVCSRVAHTSGNGVPLGTESNDKFFKALMVDVGLISAQIGLTSVKRQETEK
jgi:hypothetical protein